MTESSAAMTAPRLASITSSQSAKNPSGFSATPSRDDSVRDDLAHVQHLRLTWTLLRGRLARSKLIGAIIMSRLSDSLGIALRRVGREPHVPPRTEQVHVGAGTRVLGVRVGGGYRGLTPRAQLPSPSRCTDRGRSWTWSAPTSLPSSGTMSRSWSPTAPASTTVADVIVRRYAHDPRVVPLRVIDGAEDWVDHYNALLRQGRGEYFGFMPHDDDFPSGWIDTLVRCLETDPGLMLLFGRVEAIGVNEYTPPPRAYRCIREGMLGIDGEWTVHYVLGACQSLVVQSPPEESSGGRQWWIAGCSCHELGTGLMPTRPGCSGSRPWDVSATCRKWSRSRGGRAERRLGLGGPDTPPVVACPDAHRARRPSRRFAAGIEHRRSNRGA